MELPQVTSMGNGPLGGGDDLLGRALVVIVDDRVSTGEVTDNTGPLVTELLGEAGLVVDGTIVVPGESVAIRNALNTAVIGGVDLVVTVGGTGVSPRAVTADATAGVLDRPIPGIAEAIRASGLAAGAVDAGLTEGESRADAARRRAREALFGPTSPASADERDEADRTAEATPDRWYTDERPPHHDRD